MLNNFTETTNLLAHQDRKIRKIEEYLLLVRSSVRIPKQSPRSIEKLCQKHQLSNSSGSWVTDNWRKKVISTTWRTNSQTDFSPPDIPCSTEKLCRKHQPSSSSGSWDIRWRDNVTNFDPKTIRNNSETNWTKSFSRTSENLSKIYQETKKLCRFECVCQHAKVCWLDEG